MGHKIAPRATAASRSTGSSVQKTCVSVLVALLQLEWIALRPVHRSALHAILVFLKMVIRVRRTNAIAVMAQPQPVRIVQKMVLTNAFHATKAMQVLETFALAARRILAEHADGWIVTHGVMVLLATLTRTGACARQELAVIPLESAMRLLISPSGWLPTIRRCNRPRGRTCSVVTPSVPAYFSQVSVQWQLRQGSSVVVAMTALS